MNIFKKNEDDPLWFVVFFTIVTLAVIAIIGIFLVSVLSEEDVKEYNTTFGQESNKDQSIEAEKNAQTKKDYQQKLQQIRQLLSDSNTSKEESLQKTEDFLFEVGVPKDFLDQHFKVAMEFRSKQEKLKQKNLEQLKESLLQILSEL